jgi:glycosyltransferase involved in cell wall biosynthesis
MSRIRVLFIQHASTTSGAVVSLGVLLRNLDLERYEPILACTHPTPPVRVYYEQLGFPVVSASGIREFPHTTGGWVRLWNPRELLRLTALVAGFRSSVRAADRLLSEQSPDIVHLNSLVLVSAAIAAHRRGVPLVWHVRESAVRGHLGIRRRWLAGLVRKLPDAAVFLSRDDMGRLGRQSNWYVVPNAVEVLPSSLDRAEARHALGMDGDAKVILFMGGYSLLKGVEVLLEAMPGVARSVPGALCLLVGAHEPSTALAPRLARRMFPLIGMRTARQKVERALARVNDVVRVLPWQDDVARLYTAADVLAFPSLEPHFPRPVIEAFAYGVPVVASDLGGVREVVATGATGKLVPVGDPAALAGAIVEMLSDGKHAARMATTALQIAGERYDPAAHAREIEKIYERILAARMAAGAT